jgi:hypothetical protein
VVLDRRHERARIALGAIGPRQMAERLEKPDLQPADAGQDAALGLAEVEEGVAEKSVVAAPGAAEKSRKASQRRRREVEEGVEKSSARGSAWCQNGGLRTFTAPERGLAYSCTHSRTVRSCLDLSSRYTRAISGTRASFGLGSVSSDEMKVNTLGIVYSGLHWSFKMSRPIFPFALTLQWYILVVKRTFGGLTG